MQDSDFDPEDSDEDGVEAVQQTGSNKVCTLTSIGREHLISQAVSWCCTFSAEVGHCNISKSFVLWQMFSPSLMCVAVGGGWQQGH